MDVARVAFRHDGLTDETIRDHGTFLSELRCACGSSQLTDTLFCGKCGRTSTVVLCHRRDVWLIYIGDTGVPLDVLRCPHCHGLVSAADRLCERGQLCLLGVVGVVIQRDQSGVFELHRCIHPLHATEAHVLPAGVVMLCELPPLMSLEAQVDVLKSKTEVHQVVGVSDTDIEGLDAEVHQEVHPLCADTSVSDCPKTLAAHILQTEFVLDATAHISRSVLYDIYVSKVCEITPQTKALSRQAFFAIVRQVFPNVAETHHRVAGKLQRFFIGIRHSQDANTIY